MFSISRGNNVQYIILLRNAEVEIIIIKTNSRGATLVRMDPWKIALDSGLGGG